MTFDFLVSIERINGVEKPRKINSVVSQRPRRTSAKYHYVNIFCKTSRVLNIVYGRFEQRSNLATGKNSRYLRIIPLKRRPFARRAESAVSRNTYFQFRILLFLRRNII